MHRRGRSGNVPSAAAVLAHRRQQSTGLVGGGGGASSGPHSVILKVVRVSRPRLSGGRWSARDAAIEVASQRAGSRGPEASGDGSRDGNGAQCAVLGLPEAFAPAYVGEQFACVLCAAADAAAWTPAALSAGATLEIADIVVAAEMLTPGSAGAQAQWSSAADPAASGDRGGVEVQLARPRPRSKLKAKSKSGLKSKSKLEAGETKAADSPSSEDGSTSSAASSDAEADDGDAEPVDEDEDAEEACGSSPMEGTERGGHWVLRPGETVQRLLRHDVREEGQVRVPSISCPLQP